MKEVRYSGCQQKGNEGNYGFVPTKEEIVEMELRLIDTSDIALNSIVTLCDLTAGLGDQLALMHDNMIERGFIPFSYYCEISDLRYQQAVEKYAIKENFNMIKADAQYLRISGKNNSKKVFSIIRNNPPYMHLEQLGSSIRAEELFFFENDKFAVEGAVHIFELPLHQLIGIKNFLRKIAYRYENIHIFKFPEEEFKKYSQVVLIANKKFENSNDIELADQILLDLQSGNIPYLSDVSYPIVSLTEKTIKKSSTLEVFRDGRVTDESLSKGLLSVLDDMLEKDRTRYLSSNCNDRFDNSKPIIERLIAHRAIELNSGKFDGIRGDVLVRGGTKKVVDISEELDEEKKTIIESERIIPFIELTTQNGTILVRDK